MQYDESIREAVGILPLSQVDFQAVLGRLHKLDWVRHGGVSTWL